MQQEGVKDGKKGGNYSGRMKKQIGREESQSQEKPSRIKDLPNLRLGTERMLKKAGITTVSELKEVGAVNAFKAMQDTQETKLNLELLWALEGALNGTHWSVVTQERRDQLMKSL